MAESRKHVVLAVNSSRDILVIIERAVNAAGFDCIPVRLADLDDEGGLAAYCAKVRPDALVFDVGPPYKQNWSHLQGVLSSASIVVPVIVTSTNPAELEAEVGHQSAVQLMGKPFELDALIERIRQALLGPQG